MSWVKRNARTALEVYADGVTAALIRSVDKGFITPTQLGFVTAEIAEAVEEKLKAATGPQGIVP